MRLVMALAIPAGMAITIIMAVSGWLAWRQAIPVFGSDIFLYGEAIAFHAVLLAIVVWALVLVWQKARNAFRAIHDLSVLNRRIGGAIAIEASVQVAFIAFALGVVPLQIPVLQFVRATVLADCLQAALFISLAVMYFFAVP